MGSGDIYSKLSQLMNDVLPTAVGQAPVSTDLLGNTAWTDIAIANELFELYYPTVSSTAVGSWQFQSSTFSGWNSDIGVHPAFIGIGLYLRSWDPADPIVNVRVRIRDGAYNGTILQEVLAAKATDANDYQEFIFPGVVNSASTLFVEILTDGKSGIHATLQATTPPSTTKYTTTQDTSGTATAQVSGNFNYILTCNLLGETQLHRLTEAGIVAMRAQLDVPETIRLNLADVYHAPINELTQLFIRGIVEAPDPYQYDIEFRCSDIQAGSQSGDQYPRYYQFTPIATGDKTLTVYVRNKDGDVLATDTTIIRRTDPVNSPATNKRILCVGDSITAAGVWTSEFQRRLAGTGGSPAGKAFSNITLIGTQGSNPAKHEGYSGKTWQFFESDVLSPFVFSGVLDFTQYVTNNALTTIDHVYFYMTWNGWSTTVRPTAADWATNTASIENILDALHADYPSAKVTLCGIHLPSLNGGLALDYGDGSSALGNVYRNIRGVFGMNLSYKAIAADAAYSSFVDYIDVTSQFDCEANSAITTLAVNSRNTVTEVVGANGVHPQAAGYHQIADAVYRHFASIYCT